MSSIAHAKDTFGIYMPKEDIYNATLDVTERINKYLKSNPEDIPLAKYPIISAEDIEEYNWKTQEIILKKSIWYRIRPPSVHGAPFVIVVNGEPIYVGAFWINISSISSRIPTIIYDILKKSKKLIIKRAYPNDSFGNKSDPRIDSRIKKVLKKLGKLKK